MGKENGNITCTVLSCDQSCDCLTGKPPKESQFGIAKGNEHFALHVPERRNQVGRFSLDMHKALVVMHFSTHHVMDYSEL